MALWTMIDSKRMRMAASTILAAGALGGLPAMADGYPGERWSVDQVRINGADAAVRTGLRRASDRYFYGERSTRMDASVAGGALTLKIVDPSNGEVLIERSGLAFDSSGDVAESVTSAALNWMEGLSCVDDCRVAVSGPAPAAQVQVAAVTPAPQPEPEPELVVATPVTPAPTPVIEAPKPEPVIALATPSASASLAQPTLAAPTAAPAAQTSPGTREVKGLDADLVLAEAKRRETARLREPAPQPTAQRARPAETSVSVPTTPQAPAVAEPTTQSAGALVAAAPAASAPTVAARPAEQVVSTPIAEPSVPSTAPVEPPTATPSLNDADPVTAAAQPEAVVKQIAPARSLEQPEPSAAAALSDTATAAAPTVAPAPNADVSIAQPAPAISALPAAPAAGTAGALAETGVSALSSAPSVDTSATTETSAPETPSAPTAAELPPVETAPETTSNDLDGEQLALANPAAPVVQPDVTEQNIPAPTTEQITQPADGQTAQTPAADGSTTTVETQVAALDPEASGPTLANARWVGFTPAVFTGSDNRVGAWISGPFDRKERTGWITDTATGATTRVTFVWREGGSGGRTAILSREAAKALGLGQGDVANVAVYLPR